MQVEIRNIAAKRIACMEHRGDYTKIGQKFGELMGWAHQANAPIKGVLAVFYDDPHSTPEEQLRSDAAIEVDDSFQPNDPRVTIKSVPGGDYAVTTHFGPYDGLAKAWEDFYIHGIPGIGRKTKADMCFEMYMNDCSKVPPEQVQTDLYAPLA